MIKDFLLTMILVPVAMAAIIGITLTVIEIIHRLVS